MPDDHANFAYSLVATAPSPATTGTSLVVTAAQGALFPTVPFDATIWPTATQPLASNAEIVRVTAISTDTLTIVRAQYGTTARTVVVGDQIAATITDKVIADAEQHWDPGSQTIPVEKYQETTWHAQFTGSERLTLSGSGRLIVNDSVPVLPIIEATDYAQSFLVATGQYVDQKARIGVSAKERITVAGTGRLAVADYNPASAPWLPFVPTLAGGWALGNSTYSANYMRYGRLIVGYAVIYVGSTATIGTNLDFTLPVAALAVTGTLPQVTGTFTDTGSDVYPLFCPFYTTSTLIRLRAFGAAGTYANQANVTSTIPFAWAAADVICVNFMYEAAS